MMPVMHYARPDIKPVPFKIRAINNPAINNP